jgi:hypothetical protein
MCTQKSLGWNNEMEDIHSALLNLSHRILFFKCYTICFLFIGIWFKWARLTFCFHHLLQGKSSLCTKGVYLMLFIILWLHTATEPFSLLIYVVFRPQHPNNRMVLPIPFDWTPILVHLVRGIALWNLRNVISYKQIFVVVIQNIHWHELHGVVRQGAHLNLVHQCALAVARPRVRSCMRACMSTAPVSRERPLIWFANVWCVRPFGWATRVCNAIIF